MSETLSNPTYWIQTYGGGVFDFENIENNIFDETVVARILSRENRFGNHSYCEYSVAQHSIIVCKQFQSVKFMLAALLHDAEETYIGDIPYPLVRYLDSSKLRNLKEKISNWIYKIHNIKVNTVIKNAIKLEDLKVLERERRDLMGDIKDERYNNLKWSSEDVLPVSGKIEPWSREHSFNQWLYMYKWLTKKYEMELEHEGSVSSM